MADKESYRVAIDILCCHLGMTYDEACIELGLIDEKEDEQDVSSKQALLDLLPPEK